MENESRLIHLDMLRGMVALLVVANHARAMVLIDYSAVEVHSLTAAAFYFVTSLGHQAVLAFFALSGFLVGGTAWRKMADQNWNVRNYLAARFARLWAVLLPALVLTFALDYIGGLVVGAGPFEGQYASIFSSGPTAANPASDSLTTALGNVFFLQTIYVPVFGTNGPLWSLANEFWYYMLFPILAAVYFSTSNYRKIIFAVLFSILAYMVGFEIVYLGIIWLLGALLGYLFFSGNNKFKLRWNWGLPLSLLFVVASIIMSVFIKHLFMEIVVGSAWAFLVLYLASTPNITSLWYKRISIGLSEVSYSLYAIHFPILFLVYVLVFSGFQLVPGWSAYLIMVALIIGSLLTASIFWLCFERQHYRFRKLILRVIG